MLNSRYNDEFLKEYFVSPFQGSSLYVSLPRLPFRSQAPFTTAWAIHFQTFGPLVFHIFGWGHRPRNSDLNSYKNFNALALTRMFLG